jgi:cytochrome P450
MTEYAARALERWQDGATVDIAQEMRGLTLPIAGKALFGAEVDFEVEEISDAFATVIELHSRLTSPLAGFMRKLPLPASRRFQRALDRLHVTITRSIAARQASGIDQDDLLSALLRAQETAGDERGLTEAQVLDQMRTFLLTGYFTTTNALTWIWYLLSQHPDVEATLHAELDSVLAGRPPTVEDLKKLRYTEMVFAESLRLYPPIWIMPRWTLSDHEMGGYVVRANSLLVISQYVMHHDPRYFPEPFRFDPQRWTPEAKAERPAFAYFPFGGGPRQCIGEGFAWMEAMLILCTLAQRWQMRLVPGHPVEMEAQATTILQPKHGMLMTLKRRTLN